MAQHDYIISNQTFPNTRADINNLAEAVATNNSGTSAPTTQYAGQFWIDTTTTTWTLYIHDGTDDIQFATIDTSANTVNFTDSALDVVTDTTPQLGGNLDLNSNDITGTGNINITGNITASGNLAGTLTTASQPNITSVGTLTSATVSGDLTVDTDTLYVDSSTNRVGIGTTSPSHELEIRGVSPSIQLTDSDDSYYAIISQDYNALYIDADRGGLGSSTMRFRINNGSEAMRIDGSGRVGIGTSSPSDILHIVSTDAITVLQRTTDVGNNSTLSSSIFKNSDSTVSSIGNFNKSGSTKNSGADGYEFRLSNLGNGYTSFFNDGSESCRIDSSGNVLVGTTTTARASDDGTTLGPDYVAVSRTSDVQVELTRRSTDGASIKLRKDTLHVGNIGVAGSNPFIANQSSRGLSFGGNVVPCDNGGSSVDNASDLGTVSARFDDVYATNGTIQTSDQNEKNTITDSDLGLDFVNRLTPKSYIFNGKTRTHYGLIAQEVETVLSDISKTSTDFAGFIKSDISEEQDGSEYRYGLRYNEFIAPMIKAIQELKADNDALRARIETLENA